MGSLSLQHLDNKAFSESEKGVLYAGALRVLSV